MGRSPQYPLTIEFPASLQRWAAGFDLKLIDKEPAFVPRPAAEVPYEAVSIDPLRVWDEFWMLPLSQLRPYLRDISPLELSTTARVVKFVDHYGPLTRNPFGGDAAPDVAPLSEWRELQAELRSVCAADRDYPDSAERETLRRYSEIIDGIPHTLRVIDTPRPCIAYEAHDLRTMIWLGQLQSRLEFLFPRQCIQCGDWFQAARRDHRYCSSKCRTRRARASSLGSR